MQASYQTAKQMEAELQQKDLDISSLTKKNEELGAQLTVQILSVYKLYVCW